jgi:rifampicin phosphotransferase
MLYDLDFAHPVPADYPAPVLEALRLYLRGQGTDPTARQQEAARQREEATRATTQRLRGWRLRRFYTSLARAQRYAPLREDGLAAIGLAYPLIRQLLRELGGRMAQRGVIAAADNIFWLTEAEVRLVAGQLARSSSAGTSPRRTVRRLWPSTATRPTASRCCTRPRCWRGTATACW